MANLVNDFFEIDERGSSISHELNAGMTTFLAMVYITVVNPLILTDAGMDFGAVFVGIKVEVHPDEFPVVASALRLSGMEISSL